MTSDERAALADVHGYAAANRVRLSGHARERATERGSSPAEVVSILRVAPSCSLQPNGRVRVHGIDHDGDRLDMIVKIEDGLVVVTLYG